MTELFISIKKKGYEKKYDLYYYSHDAPSDIQAALPEDVTVKRINLDILRSLRDQTKGHSYQLAK